jgi:hypothetical protein
VENLKASVWRPACDARSPRVAFLQCEIDGSLQVDALIAFGQIIWLTHPGARVDNIVAAAIAGQIAGFRTMQRQLSSAIIRSVGRGIGQSPHVWHDRKVRRALSIVVRVLSELISWCGLVLRPRRSLEAEILFLRRQLALYVERGVKPRRIDSATRMSLAFLSRWFAWRSALIVVRPETLIRWHRAGFRLLWRWKSRSGRPRSPQELRELTRTLCERFELLTLALLLVELHSLFQSVGR